MFNLFAKPVRLLTSVTALSLFIITPALAAVISFDNISDANAIVFGDFVGKYNDSQGSLIVGGNATLTGYTVGTLNQADKRALTVSGNLDLVGGDVNGLAYVGGTASVSNTNALRAAPEMGIASQAHFISLSESLSVANNANANAKWSQLTLQSAAFQDTLIAHISPSQFSDFTSVFTAPEQLGSRIVLNISGNDITMGAKDWLLKTTSWLQHDASNVLFNFYEATSLTINTSLYGSVLAPNADVFGTGGMINGQFIANSFTTGINGGTQLNYAPFNADDTPPLDIKQVSEPHAAALLLLGLGALLIGRFKRSNV
ncbi:choice-of-anchor A family protein [Alteromonas oceanisediminis]|uniref:choice-of-anchor A family protein n=1 Tax=Alteromonas oceanisediminis TaxID=2836180 RepID=UPI001BDA0062|nr:choice-of-anchor A family protein [Alteromonas oceanisediminis]MBT0587691.1 choice-of-anchor A family protein [Alteromonas oceanisediminis]